MTDVFPIESPTDMRHWFPRIDGLVPTPDSRLVEMTREEIAAAMRLMEADPAATDLDLGALGAPGGFLERLRAAADEVAGNADPVFLRTSHTSGKHGWRDTCHVTNRDKLIAHVMAIIEYSELAGMPGLPWYAWYAREMLDVLPVAYAPQYGSMPLVPEWRVFVRDGTIECMHPYWPLKAIKEGNVHEPERVHALLSAPPDDERILRGYAIDAAKAASEDCPVKYWSVDLLRTQSDHWYVTDMAEGQKSYHEPGCPFKPARK